MISHRPPGAPRRLSHVALTTRGERAAPAWYRIGWVPGPVASVGWVGELLLLSNSTAPGMGFLEHATDAIRAVLGDRGSLLFVPFASSDPDAYARLMRQALTPAGIGVTSLHQVSDLTAAVAGAEAVFVGGGNSFRLLRTLISLDVMQALRQAAEAGVPYLGASAGTNLACPTIRTTNDMPIVEPGSLAALGLIPFQLNPHYLDPDPRSPHQGEARPKRIEEFLEENDVPVLGLREGAWLQVSGTRAQLSGRNTGRLFRRRTDPIDIPVGTDVSYLLDTRPRFDIGPAPQRSIEGTLDKFLSAAPCLYRGSPHFPGVT
jgi:dipeptidase E